MEDVDCITISDSECNDDDEVEILDYFYNVEPITVDLTKAPPRRPFQQHQPQPQSEPTPNKQGRVSPPEEEDRSQKQQSQQQHQEQEEEEEEQQQQQQQQQHHQQPKQNSQFTTQGGTQSRQYISQNNSHYVGPPRFFQPPPFLQPQRHHHQSFQSAEPQGPPLFRPTHQHTQNNNFHKSQQHQQHQPQPPKPPTVPPQTGRPTTQPRAQPPPQAPSSKLPQQQQQQQQQQYHQQHQQQQRVQPQPPISRPQPTQQPSHPEQPPCPQQPPQHQPLQSHPVQQQQPQQQKPGVQEQQTADKPPISDHELMIVLKEQGNKKFRSNLLDEAVRLYREAGELARKLGNKDMSAILHFNLAMSYDKLGSHNQAADECAAAVKIDDKYMKAHCKRAEIYMSQGKFDEAVICYEHICEIDSSKREEAMRRISYAKELAKSNRKRDQYEILGLRPHFTAEQLKTCYKQKARAHHPDRHSDADIVTRRIQEKIFKEASEANAFFRKKFGYN